MVVVLDAVVVVDFVADEDGELVVALFFQTAVFLSFSSFSFCIWRGRE